MKEVGGSAEDTKIRSSHTGRQNIVNLTLDGLAVKEDPVAMGWPDALPKRGVLRFDFAALGVDGLASACVLLDDAAFANTSRDVGSRRLTPRERLEALEHARRDRAFTCAQVAALLETFDVGESRVDATAALLPRLAPLPPRDGRGGLGLAAEAQATRAGAAHGVRADGGVRALRRRTRGTSRSAGRPEREVRAGHGPPVRPRRRRVARRGGGEGCRL